MSRTKAGFFFVKTLDGSPPAKMNFPLVAGTYHEGALLRVSGTSGSAVKAAVTNTACIGVAGAYIETTTSGITQMPVYLADSKNVFEAVMVATGAPQARMADRAHFRVGTTHNFRLQGTAGTAMFRIVGVHPDDAAGTGANKRYWIVFNKTKFNRDAES